MSAADDEMVNEAKAGIDWLARRVKDLETRLACAMEAGSEFGKAVYSVPQPPEVEAAWHKFMGLHSANFLPPEQPNG